MNCELLHDIVEKFLHNGNVFKNIILSNEPHFIELHCLPQLVYSLILEIAQISFVDRLEQLHS